MRFFMTCCSTPLAAHGHTLRKKPALGQPGASQWYPSRR
jgi:hypothetical protein